MKSPVEIRAELECQEADARVRCLAVLVKGCLPLLSKYFSHDGRAEYQDSVVGMRHSVDVALPGRVVAAVLEARGLPSKSKLAQLLHDYQEPIVAHQDDDLRFSDDRAEFAYLACYNLLQVCTEPADSDRSWRVVAQVLSALLPTEPLQNDVERILNDWRSQWEAA